MSDNAHKTPIGRSLNQFAESKIAAAIQLLGKALPCSVVSKAGSIVTVKFEINSGFTLPMVTIPMFGPEYIRYPIQAGDKGVVFAADARLGGVSGLGGGVANLSTPANLTALVFFPISNTAWSDVDPDAVTIYGPNGVVLRNTDSTTTITLTPGGLAVVGENTITLVCGLTSITFDKAGGLVFTDGVAMTSPSTMNSVWALLETWLNTHTHTDDGAGIPTVPYTGGTIAPSI